MNITDFLIKTYKPANHGFMLRPELVLNDGFKMSVQASSGHYCSPRQNQKVYSSVEIGFPSEEEMLIFEYAENKNGLTQTVYGWVPCEVVDEVIEKHGGINIEETFKQK